MSLPVVLIAAALLTVGEARDLAVERDPVLQALAANERALLADAEADAQLPDPELRAGLMRERGSGARIEFMQAFPPGSSRALLRHRGVEAAEAQYQLAAERRLALRNAVDTQWIRLNRVHRERETLREALQSVSTLLENVESQAAQGRARQQDIVAVRIEHGRMQRRLHELDAEDGRARAELARLVGPDALREDLAVGNLPPHPAPDRTQLYDRITSHPAVLASDAVVRAASTDADIVREAYRPRWSLAVGRTQRDGDSMMPNETSVMASVSLPLFTTHRQDRRHAAASDRLQMRRSERLDTLYRLQARAEDAYARWTAATSSGDLYRESLLPAAALRADIAMADYRSGTGSLSDALRARIEALEVRLEWIRVDADGLEALAEFAYLSGGDA